MKELEEEFNEKPGEKAVVRSRRSILTGSAALLLGGIAGRLSNAYAEPAPQYAPAPPLPWPWTNLDPMEAGTRAYQNYLKNKG